MTSETKNEYDNINISFNEVTVCLNMIVKNESKILTRLFDSVLPLIDTYCICDTGSTDNTIQMIKDYFDSKNISGKIVVEPFKNFCHNRNFALQSAVGMSDYLLLLDADMILEKNSFDKKLLSSLKMYEQFYLIQGSENFYYQNMRIIRNNGLYKYVGVTHEYIDTPPGTNTFTIDKKQLFIRDIGDGGSKSDKYERDIRLLTKGIEEEPENAIRYTFYLANSYHDSGKYEDAIQVYKKRAEMGGWNQEIWYSKYRIGCCYRKMQKMSDAIYHWLDAYNYLPDRVENLYEIVNHYRNCAKNNLALHFYQLAKNIISEKKDIDSYLFLHKDIYTYKLDYEFSIFAFYTGVRNINDIIVNIFNECIDNDSTTNNLLNNMKFYKDILVPISKKDMSSEIDIEINGVPTKFFSSSSCLIPSEKGGYYMNQRFVNYYINSNGSYLNCDKYIISSNKFLELGPDLSVIREKQFDLNFEERRYIGIEDIKIYNDSTFNNDDRNILFIGTGYHKSNTIGIVNGNYDINNNILISNELYQTFNNSQCEKNWVFVDYNGSTHMIYKWGPMQICKTNDTSPIIEIVKTIIMPNIFSHVRGSTCGFKYIKKMNNPFYSENIHLNIEEREIWFVVHLVSYETPRHYYHMIVVFDNDMNLLRYSAPFKFDGSPIEYCLSIVVNDEHVIMNYSTWDRTTIIGVYDKNYIESKLKYN